LAEDIVARVNNKGQISLSTFRAKDEVITLLSDHPVEYREDSLHQVDVISLRFGVRTHKLVLRLLWDPVFPVGALEAGLLLLLVMGIGSEVVNPGEFERSDQEIHASLEGFNTGQLWDGALVVEVLNPTFEIGNFLSQLFSFDIGSALPGRLPLVKSTDQVGKGDEIGDSEVLLLEEGVRSSNAFQVADDSGSTLREHKLE